MPPPSHTRVEVKIIGFSLSRQPLTPSRLPLHQQEPAQGGADVSDSPARWAPTELNAIDEQTLRARVLAAVERASSDPSSMRTPLLAPFITHAVLFRVRQILVSVVATGTLHKELGHAVAALTGAPRLTDDEARHMGQKAATRVHQHDKRMKPLRCGQLTKAKAARMKEDCESLFVEGMGGTPPALRAWKCCSPDWLRLSRRPRHQSTPSPSQPKRSRSYSR